MDVKVARNVQSLDPFREVHKGIQPVMAAEHDLAALAEHERVADSSRPGVTGDDGSSSGSVRLRGDELLQGYDLSAVDRQYLNDMNHFVGRPNDRLYHPTGPRDVEPHVAEARRAGRSSRLVLQHPALRHFPGEPLAVGTVPDPGSR
jgi:hypothetical protein